MLVMVVDIERCVKILAKFILSVLILVSCVLTVYISILGLTTLGALGSSYFVGNANTYFWIVYGIFGTYTYFRGLTVCVEYFNKIS